MNGCLTVLIRINIVIMSGNKDDDKYILNSTGQQAPPLKFLINQRDIWICMKYTWK